MRRSHVIAGIASLLPLLLAGAPSPATAANDGGAHVKGAAERVLAGQQALASGMATGTDGGSARGDAGDTTVAAVADQFALSKSLPALHVSAAAMLAAHDQATALETTGGSWRQQTTVGYNAEPAGYTDPFWSNAGAGWSLVGGRATALAADGNSIFLGAADGGVWRSDNNGATWRPLTDQLPSLSVGAIAVNSTDHSVWIGLGEANTNADSYLGTGVYRSGEHGENFRQVGGTALVDRQVYQILFDGAGSVYAATNRGLFKTSADGEGSWSAVLLPDAADSFPPYTNHITTVAIRPGTGSQEVIAVDGYRSGSAFNAFYVSTDGAKTFTKIAPAGLDNTDIGRTGLTYASDGKLYALIQSPKLLNTPGSPSVLKGVYVSPSGDPAGPWTLIANTASLEASGSALTAANSPGYQVGIQAWYNQVITTDPKDPNKLFVSLEESFQSNDGGKTFFTTSPYWDFGLACGTACPKTTHPDQHAILIKNGRLFIGNDGGVYSRPETVTGYGSWTDLNATLHNLQFYDAKAGGTGRGLTFWGGMQDNGNGLLANRTMIEPAGGDGFDTIINPTNTQQLVGEYTSGATYYTTDGGHSFVNVSPSCYGQSITFGVTRADCDPNNRFWSPLTSDQLDPSHWLAGGRYVWETTKGWSTTCDTTTTTCDWKPVYDLGASSATTALTGAGGVEYAAWVRGSGNPSSSFASGIATSYGGAWHQLSMSGLPSRLIAGVTVDKSDPAHVYAIFNGFSRRWIPGGGLGVVFESHDGGATWANITGNLPDAPGDALVLSGHSVVLATDVGVFTAEVGESNWSRLGEGLPNVSVNDINLTPDGSALVAATHGRGIWTLRLED